MEDRIIDKIRKLLSLADSDNEHEAKIAMERANELLLRHNLTQSQVGASSSITEIETDEFIITPVEDKFILRILDNHFFVKILIHSHTEWREEVGTKRYKKIRMIGTKLNVEVAEYTYGFLLLSFKRSWQHYRKATKAPASDRQAYYLGLQKGIEINLYKRKEAVQQETGLIWVGDRDIDNYLADVKIGRAKPMPKIRGNLAAFDQGVEAGRELELTKALKRDHGSSNSGKLLK